MAAVSATTQAQDHPDLVLVSNEYTEPERVTPAVYEARQAVEASAGELAALDTAHGIMSEVRGAMENDSLGLINLVEDSSLCYVLEDFEVGDECIAIAERVQLAMLDLQIAQAESRVAEKEENLQGAETDLADTQTSVAEREANVADQLQTIDEVQSETAQITAAADEAGERADAEAERADANAIVLAALTSAEEEPLTETNTALDDES